MIKGILTFMVLLMGFLHTVCADESQEFRGTITALMKDAREKNVTEDVSWQIRFLMERAREDKDQFFDFGKSIVYTEEKLSSSRMEQLILEIQSDDRIKQMLSGAKEPQTNYGERRVFLEDSITYRLPKNSKQKLVAADPEYIAAIKNELGLVGIHLHSGNQTIALQELGGDSFRFVNIEAGGFGLPFKLRIVSEEFSRDQLVQLGTELKKAIRKYKGLGIESPMTYFSSGAIKMFNSAGFASAVVGASIVAGAALLDVVTAVIQLPAWGLSKVGQYWKKRRLAKRTDITSDDVRAISLEEYNVVNQAIRSTIPNRTPYLTLFCREFYRN